MEKTQPELKSYMGKKIRVKINGNRAVEGLLDGYDEYTNLVIKEAFDVTHPESKQTIGTIV